MTAKSSVLTKRLRFHTFTAMRGALQTQAAPRALLAPAPRAAPQRAPRLRSDRANAARTPGGPLSWSSAPLRPPLEGGAAAPAPEEDPRGHAFSIAPVDWRRPVEEELLAMPLPIAPHDDPRLANPLARPSTVFQHRRLPPGISADRSPAAAAGAAGAAGHRVDGRHLRV